MFLPYNDAIQAGQFLTTSTFPFVEVAIPQSNLVETVYLKGNQTDTTQYLTGILDQREQRNRGHR